MSIENANRLGFGKILIGLVFSAMLHGVSIAQILTFAKKSKNDPLAQKLVVWFIWLLDMIHLILMIHMVFHYLVSRPADPTVIWSIPVNVLVQVSILPIAQWLYVARIWKIANKGRRYVPAILGFLVILNLVAGFITAVKLFHTSKSHKTLHHIPAEVSTINSSITTTILRDTHQPAVTFFLSTTSFLDFLIAGSLCYMLSKTGTNLSWTDSNLIMLLAYLVNTGAIVSLFSVSVLITYLVTKPALTFLAVGAVSTKFYVNSFLGMVNARHYFQSPKPSMTLVLHSETPSQHDKMDSNPQRQSKTINEVGLPLFQPSLKSEDIKMLEIMVKQEAHSSKM